MKIVEVKGIYNSRLDTVASSQLCGMHMEGIQWPGEEIAYRW